MAYSKELAEHIIDMLEPLGNIKLRPMFGGAGIYYGATMFGLIADDAVYFKVDDANKDDYLAANCEPFSYLRKGKPTYLKSYYQLPDEVLENPDDAIVWGRSSVDAALKSSEK